MEFSIFDILNETTIVKNLLYSMSASFFMNDNMHYNGTIRNFGRIFKLAQGESSALGGVSAIMDNIWDMESGLVFFLNPDHKINEMSNQTSTTNNNIFVIGSIEFNSRFLHL